MSCLQQQQKNYKDAKRQKPNKPTICRDKAIIRTRLRYVEEEEDMTLRLPE